MDKDFLIQLTKNLYRLTLLFPKKEPLRYKMREMADDILADSINNQHPELVKRLEVLDSFFEVAKVQNWVSPYDILAIQKEYDILKGELKKEKIENQTLPFAEGFGSASPASADNSVDNSEKKEKPLVVLESRSVSTQALPTKSMSERQEMILAFLRENGRVQVWQVKQILPEVTKRTLRRDFEQLLEQGLIERIGERNDTFYQLKIKQSPSEAKPNEG